MIGDQGGGMTSSDRLDRLPTGLDKVRLVLWGARPADNEDHDDNE